MDIPNEVLEKLKCNKCGVYLSRGPVYLQHDGVAACGRCFAPERPSTRNTQYESVAQLLLFPCKYVELGCRETVPFAHEDEVIAHEEVCAHREWVCPVLGSSHCDWLGSRTDILQHCQQQHEDRVLDNPCNLEHNITKSSDRTFLVRAFHVLFLLHAKVCVTRAKIYHSVRHLGDSNSASKFKFSVNVSRGECAISRLNDVAPQGCLAIQEATSVALDINSLLSVLGGFTGTLFTVEVKPRTDPCSGCRTQDKVLVYRDEAGWRCERCAPARRACRNQNKGCSHYDINAKSLKHEWYYCQERTLCLACSATLKRGSLLAHYVSACKAVYKVGSTWRVTRTGGQHCLVSGVVGIAVCEYWLHDSVFGLRVYTPLPSERLSEFRCELRVTHVTTGLVRIYKTDNLYNEPRDWHIVVKKEDFPSWDTDLDICLEFFEK